MTIYKDALLDALNNSGWELVSKNNDNNWWLEEFWTMRSVQKNWGDECYILFLVDPMCDSRIDKSSAVWAILATTEPPAFDKEPDKEIIITDFVLQKGKQKKNIKDFTEEINRY